PPVAPDPGLNELSGEPSAFRRAMALRPVPATLVKDPPMTILPSGCSARASTEPLGVELKELSSEPLVLKRTITGLLLIFEPLAMIFPSDCKTAASFERVIAEPGSNEGSTVPSAFRRAMNCR